MNSEPKGLRREELVERQKPQKKPAATPTTKALGRKLLNRWRSLLRIRHWRLQLLWEEMDSMENYGSFSSTGQRPEAVITIWSGIRRKDLEDTIVHELLHAVILPLDQLLAQWGSKLDDEDAKLLQRQYEDARENIIDHLTQAMIYTKNSKTTKVIEHKTKKRKLRRKVARTG